MAAFNGVQLELGVRNLSAIASNFVSSNDELIDELQRLAREAAGDIHTLAEMLCAKRTGFMAEHIVERFTPSGLGFEVGWDATDFLGAGLAFYPWFVEFGTRHMRAQPALGPAADYILPEYQQRVSTTLTSWAQRLSEG